MLLGDNGTLTLWDYNTGTAFQNMDDIPQPGSLEAEAGVFCSTFDATGTRLITGGADKTIKVGTIVHYIFSCADTCAGLCRDTVAIGFICMLSCNCLRLTNLAFGSTAKDHLVDRR